MSNLWKRVTDWNDEFFPDWRSRKPIYYSNALAGECGEVCNSVKHLEGGGTHIQPSSSSYRTQMLEECIDVYIYMVLLLESQGYTEEDFERAFSLKINEITSRMKGGKQ